MDILKLTALELGEKIKKKEVSVREAVDAVLARAEEAEPVINSYVTLDREGAYAQADEIQKKIDAGELDSPLAGVPVAVKDNMCIRGQLTTCSSKILSNFKPTYTAEAVENLRKAGAVIIGKTNMDEFAHGEHNRDFLLRTDKKSTQHGACARRFFRRLLRGGGCGGMLLRAGIRHRRLHPPAQFVLRRGRNEADLRDGFPIWPCGIWIFP